MTETSPPSASLDMPVVTIVTPTYNRERYLGATVESVLAQTYPRVEYIVVDDGSTDRTRELCARYERVVYRRQNNAGQSAAINAGWSQAAGKYLMYLSSDDLLEPSAVRDLVEIAEKQDREVILYPDYHVIDASGRWLSDVVLGPFDADDFFTGLNCMIGPGALFSKSLFDRYGGWNAALRKVPDYEYWLRLSNDAMLMNVPEFLASSRNHPEAISFSAVSPRRSLEIVRVARRYIVPKAPGREDEVLAKVYTTSMRYFLRSGQFGHVCGLLGRIWTIRKWHFASYTFWRSVAGELRLLAMQRMTAK